MRITMKTILMLALLAATAHADAPTCKKEGAPIFEIDRKDTANPKSLQAATLYASGAWTFEATDADGKKSAPTSGCLSADAMRKIKQDLAAAKWKTTTAKIHCMAISPLYTAYKAGGKQVFEAHVCGGQTLDDDSNKAVQDLEKELAVAFPKT
jgi:hypothetical protein